MHDGAPPSGSPRALPRFPFDKNSASEREGSAAAAAAHAGAHWAAFFIDEPERLATYTNSRYRRTSSPPACTFELSTSPPRAVDSARALSLSRARSLSLAPLSQLPDFIGSYVAPPPGLSLLHVDALPSHLVLWELVRTPPKGAPAPKGARVAVSFGSCCPKRSADLQRIIDDVDDDAHGSLTLSSANSLKAHEGGEVEMASA